jgi:hypothetical protein
MRRIPNTRFGEAMPTAAIDCNSPILQQKHTCHVGLRMEQIAFISVHDGNWKVFLTSAQGGTPQELLPVPGELLFRVTTGHVTLLLLNARLMRP